MPQEIKTALISAMIRREYLNNGGDVKAAFDAVMGEGAFKKLANEVYQELRAA